MTAVGRKYTFTWGKGRNLQATTLEDGRVVKYSYDDTGLRMSKEIYANAQALQPDQCSYYYYDGTAIIAECQYSRNSDGELAISAFLGYSYDDNGEILYLTYKNDFSDDLSRDTYLLYKNGVGEVEYLVHVLNRSSTGAVTYKFELAAQYVYSAYGEFVCTDLNGHTVGSINPILYKGYVYDRETGLYYLQSRYYSPYLCKFISMDEPQILLLTSNNFSTTDLYEYCNNNPVSNMDRFGYWVATVGGAIGATVILGVSASAAIIFDGKGNFGLLISIYMPLFGYGLGPSGFIGYFRKYKTVYDYKNAVMNTHSIGYYAGVDIVHDYPKYPNSYKARIVGFQLTVGNGPTMTYTPNSIYAKYIPLNKKWYNAWKSLKSFLKTVKIKFLVKRK